MWVRVSGFKTRISRIMAKRLKFDKKITNNVDSMDATSSSEVVMNKTNSKISKNVKDFIYLQSPIKSPSDVKEYSVIRLKNGLTALLISDKSQIVNLDELSEKSDSDSEFSESDSEASDSGSENSYEQNDISDHTIHKTSGCDEKLAACALCVGVGSFSDPESIPGLAHFLEHMIFMGSEKYPKENEFDVFIKKKGGSDNASTECEYTTFYFDCHETHLFSAMDIFSHLFISPIMNKDSMTKEREAIESEFQMSLPSDESRKSQLLCSFAHDSNPAHKFMWGNLITLKDRVKDDQLYEAVHEFRRKHYSAHRMTLAIQARLPMDTLENWVVDCFENVPNNGLLPDEFILTEPPFKQAEFSKLYIVEPVKNINHLDLTWVTPSTLKMYKAKPLNYLSWVIGHEGKGSLVSYLRQKLWCFDITVSSGGDGTEENSIYTFFSITLILTHEGIQHVEEILNSVFEYIGMFQDIGPEERLFDEIKLVSETTFRFAEEVPSSDNVEQLSENMHYYPSIDYITGSELFFEYNPQLIKSFLNNLRADNVNIMISSKALSSTENLDKVEPWFGTRYKVKEIPRDWINNWEDKKLNTHFYLPEKNPFITSNFTILASPNNPKEFPKTIFKDSVLELWYKQDVTFKLPYAFCCLHLISPLPHKSAQNAAILDLYISILKQSLAEQLYPANVAQLEYSFHSGEKGIVIIVNGFNEKLIILLQNIFSGMLLLRNNVKPDMVLAMQDELQRDYSNANIKPSYLCRDIRMSILLETFWTALEKERALKEVTFEKVKEFMSQYFEKLNIQCLIQGNISKEEAFQFGELVKNELSCNPLLIDATPEIRVNQLPIGENYCVVNSFAEDPNSIVTNYYQSGLGTIQESCIIEMLLMMMEEPIFDSLRTKQQLGYDVSCSLRDTFGVLGFSVTVNCQSDRNSVEFVQTRITEFLRDFLETLKSTSAEDFSEIQESLIKLKKCADIHLKEEVKRNWDEIKSEEYVFDRHYKEIEHIKSLTLEDVIKWFESISGVAESSKSKKLSIQVAGKISNDSTDSKSQSDQDDNNIASKTELKFISNKQSNDKYITNIQSFKDSLTLYPIHKIT